MRTEEMRQWTTSERGVYIYFMTRPASPPPPSTDAAGLVIGLDNIAGLFGRSRYAVKRWVASDEFPAAQLPDGTYVSTTRLIDEWIERRATAQREGL